MMGGLLVSVVAVRSIGCSVPTAALHVLACNFRPFGSSSLITVSLPAACQIGRVLDTGCMDHMNLDLALFWIETGQLNDNSSSVTQRTTNISHHSFIHHHV